jgi:hypothetical protein
MIYYHFFLLILYVPFLKKGFGRDLQRICNGLAFTFVSQLIIPILSELAYLSLLCIYSHISIISIKKVYAYRTMG